MGKCHHSLKSNLKLTIPWASVSGQKELRLCQLQATRGSRSQSNLQTQHILALNRKDAKWSKMGRHSREWKNSDEGNRERWKSFLFRRSQQYCYYIPCRPVSSSSPQWNITVVILQMAWWELNQLAFQNHPPALPTSSPPSFLLPNVSHLTTEEKEVAEACLSHTNALPSSACETGFQNLIIVST